MPISRRILAGAALATGAAVLVGIWQWPARLGPPAPQGGELSIGGPFRLVDGGGRTVTDADLRGKYFLVYFGYTFCPDVCPTTLNEMAGALAILGEKGNRLTPVFISIDPARDTPAVVKTYVAAFSPRLLGLTGSAEQVAAAASAYRVFYAKRPTGTKPNDYVMDHTSLMYLMGPDGAFIAPIAADKTAAELAAAIGEHLS